jgi:hypothetical protein
MCGYPLKDTLTEGGRQTNNRQNGNRGKLRLVSREEQLTNKLCEKDE